MLQEDIRKSILVADDDLGFALWAGSVLAETGYPNWPPQEYPNNLITVAASTGAICLSAGIGILRLAKLRRARTDRAMRDHVRRAY